MTKEIRHVTDPEKDLERFRQFLLQQERAPATVSAYLRSAGLLLDFAGERKQIDKEILIAFKEHLWVRYKPASCNAIIAGVNQFLKSLGLEKLKLRQFKTQKMMMRPEERYLTCQECRRIIEAAEARQKTRLAAAMGTIALTGARISELKFFTVEGVRKGRIQVRNKGKMRVILLPQVLRTHLLQYAANENIRKGCIFITSSGKPVDRSNMWREMRQLAADAGVDEEKLFPHNLRHRFAHTYFQTTKDLAGLGDILGHSNLNVTRIYTMKTEEIQRKTLNRIGSAFAREFEDRT